MTARWLKIALSSKKRHLNIHIHTFTNGCQHFAGEKPILETRCIKQHAFLVDPLRVKNVFSNAPHFDVFVPKNEGSNQERGSTSRSCDGPKREGKTGGIPSFERRKGPRASRPPCR